MSSAAGPSGGGQQPEPTNLATAVAEVSERASKLVREEIELAKAELEVKATSIAKGTVVGVVAGVFFVTALLFLLIGCAWLLYYILPGNDFTYFWGFFAMAVILVILGVIAGLVASKVVKKGAPPVPTMAIDEAQKLRSDISGVLEEQPAAPVPAPVAVAAAARPTPAPAAAPPTVAEPPAAGADQPPAGTPEAPNSDPEAGPPAEGQE